MYYHVSVALSFFLSFFLSFTNSFFSLSICPSFVVVCQSFVVLMVKKKVFLRSRVVSRRKKCRFEVVSFLRCLLTSLFFSLFFLFLLSRDVRNCQFETRALASSRRREISFGDESREEETKECGPE